MGILSIIIIILISIITPIGIAIGYALFKKSEKIWDRKKAENKMD